MNSKSARRTDAKKKPRVLRLLDTVTVRVGERIVGVVGIRARSEEATAGPPLAWVPRSELVPLAMSLQVVIVR